jgi:hypothetical protein
VQGAGAAFGAERDRQVGDVFLGGRLEARTFLGVGFESDGAYVVAEDLPERFDAAARTGAGIISDEVWAPLTLPGRTFNDVQRLRTRSGEPLARRRCT